MNVPSLPQKTNARIAGILYLSYIISSIIAEQFGRFVFVDARETIRWILSNEFLFRIGISITLFSYVLFLAAAWFLYLIFKPVNSNSALLLLLLHLCGYIICNLSMISLLAGLQLINGSEISKLLLTGQDFKTASLLIDSRTYFTVIAQIPYGLWLIPLGWLIYQSEYFPRIFGILLIIDCFGLLFYVFQQLLFPEYEMISYPCFAISFIAECGLALYLCIFGIRKRKTSQGSYPGKR